MRRVHISMVAIGAAVALALAGCGGDDDDDAADTDTTEATNAPDETEAPDTSAPPESLPTEEGGPVDVSTTAFPETSVTAPLESGYISEGEFDPAGFGVPPGAVTIKWYLVDGFWAAHYDGLTPAVASDKCPGTSIETSGGFEFVTNSPYGALACEGFTSEVLPPGSLFNCNDEIVYVTDIPADTEGTLYASLEKMVDDAVIAGVTSEVAADASAAADIEINVSNCQVIS
jgi:hypothetical protein